MMSRIYLGLAGRITPISQPPIHSRTHHSVPTLSSVIFWACPDIGGLARVKRTLDMLRYPTRRDQHGVEADVGNARVGMIGEPGFGGRDDAAALALGHRPGGIVELVARLDLDEHEQAAPPCHDVDLADRAAIAPRQDAEALGNQQRRRPALGRDAEAEGNLALGSR